VMLIGTPDAADSVDRLFITNLATERIAGIGRIRNQAATLNCPYDHRHAARLRISWVHFNEFSHRRIVGELRLRGYPLFELLFATVLTIL